MSSHSDNSSENSQVPDWVPIDPQSGDITRSHNFAQEIEPNEYSRLMDEDEQWKELEKDQEVFWKAVGKRKIIFRGMVSDLAQVGGGLRKDYFFKCSREPQPEELPIASVRVKFDTRKNIPELISDGDTVWLLGKLRKGKPFEPEKIYNQTTNTSINL
jgi:hypothetical protein